MIKHDVSHDRSEIRYSNIKKLHRYVKPCNARIRGRENPRVREIECDGAKVCYGLSCIRVIASFFFEESSTYLPRYSDGMRFDEFSPHIFVVRGGASLHRDYKIVNLAMKDLGATASFISERIPRRSR